MNIIFIIEYFRYFVIVVESENVGLIFCDLKIKEICKYNYI